MKSPTSFLLASLLAAALPLAAAANPPQNGSSHPDKMSGRHGNMHRGSMGGMHWMGKNVVEGVTRNIDHQNGVMHVQAEGRQLIVHFPPSALGKLETGENVTIKSAFSDRSRMMGSDMHEQSGSGYHSSSAGMKSARGSTMNDNHKGMGMKRSGWIGEHTMPGTVTQINPTNGTLDLKTDEGVLVLRFPSSSLTEVRQGDKLMVYLALKKS